MTLVLIVYSAVKTGMSLSICTELTRPLLLNLSLTLFSLMDYPIHIDTLSMELSILYFKGLPVKISIK